MDTTIIYKNFGALEKAHSIENYYGFNKPISGHALGLSGMEQAERLGVAVRKDEVVGLSLDERFHVETVTCSYEADAVIIATGASHTAPPIRNHHEYEGKGISYCAVCDAFFYRGKNVAVLGGGEYALHEARTLMPVVGSVTVLTNGNEIAAEFPDGIRIITDTVSTLTGGDTLSGVVFENGGSVAVSGLFVAIGVAGSVALAQKIGAAVSGNDIIVNDKMQTSVPGLFAAGDCTGNMRQIAKAVYEGAIAGTAAVNYVRGGF